MSKWVKYTGSDEQIAEIKANIHGYLVRNALGMLSSRVRVAFDLDGVGILPFEYLICNPHPLADMICQQVRTGQPVHIKVENGTGNHLLDISTGFYYFDLEHSVFITNTPDWNIPNAEYSFAEFKEEV